MKSTLRRAATAFLLLASAAAGTVSASRADKGAPLVLSLPPGGCTLMVFPNGSGRILYGAAPRIVQVAPQTFDFPHVLQSLRAGMQGRQADAHAEPVASVVFPGTNVALRSGDTPLARSLLETGWKSRLPPGDMWDENSDAQDWIKRACEFE